MKRLRQIGEYWTRLSGREQRLAVLVLGLAAALVCVTLIRRAKERIDELDSSIMMMEDGIVQAQYQIARREAVEEEYRGVAAQHSSAWSEAEILDRLRNEVYRLAHNVPSPLNDNGVADQVENGSGLLVNLPELGEGALNTNDKGFREYQINVKVSNVSLPAMISYLERLQASPQSLRVDGLDLSRNFLDDRVTASIDLTRIVVDRTESPWTYIGQASSQWVNKGCHIADASAPKSAGRKAVQFTSAGPKGASYLAAELEAGELYELELEASARGKVSLRLFDESANQMLTGNAVLTPDEQPYSYRIRFALAGEKGTKSTVRVPIISLDEPDCEVYVTSLAYRKST